VFVPGSREMAKSEMFVLTFSPGELQAGGGGIGCVAALSCRRGEQAGKARLTGDLTVEGEPEECGLRRRVDKVGGSCKTQTQIRSSLR